MPRDRYHWRSLIRRVVGDRGGDAAVQFVTEQAQQIEKPSAPNPHRWRRRRDKEIIPVEIAAGHEPAADPREALAKIAEAEMKRLASEQRARDMESQIGALLRQLKQLDETVRIVKLRSFYYETSLKTLQSQQPKSASPPTNPAPASPLEELYRQVGLTPDCPNAVFEAARKALLALHHPDRVSAAEKKARATADFQYYSRIFESLREARIKRSRDQA